MEHQWVPSIRSIKLGDSFVRSFLIVASLVKLQRTVFPSGRAGFQAALIPQKLSCQRLCMLDSPKSSGQRWPHYGSCAGVEDQEYLPATFVVDVCHFGRTRKRRELCVRGFPFRRRAE